MFSDPVWNCSSSPNFFMMSSCVGLSVSRSSRSRICSVSCVSRWLVYVIQQHGSTWKMTSVNRKDHATHRYLYLHQELISYRYSSCCCCCCCCSSSWCGDLLKSARLLRSKSDRDKIYQECSSCKCALTHGVEFSFWRHNFKMAAMTSFYVQKSAVLQFSEWKRRACRAYMQQHTSVPDL